MKTIKPAFALALCIALILIALAFATPDAPAYSTELKIGEKAYFESIEFAVRDLSADTAILTVSRFGNMLEPLFLIPTGQSKSISGVQVTVEITSPGGIRAVKLSFSKILPPGFKPALTEEQAKQKFLEYYPQYPKSSLSSTVASCEKSGNYCYVISGFKIDKIQGENSQEYSFLDGTIAFIDPIDGSLVNALKTN